MSIEVLGVIIEINVVVGKMIMMEEIMLEFDVCYLLVGVGVLNFMGILGISLNGVYFFSEFLIWINLMYSYEFLEYDILIKCVKNVVVIGGGNVVMDVVCLVKWLGVENVNIVYCCLLEELLVRIEEYYYFFEEGINYYWLMNLIVYLDD